MKTIILDANIYDRIEHDNATKRMISRLTKSKIIEIVVPRIILEELKNSPFKGLPDDFPTKIIPDGIPVAGLAIAGDAIVSDGETYSLHLGESKKHSKDAVIAETANNIADVFVSEDNRCRKRLDNNPSKVKCFNHDDFCVWLSGISSEKG